MMSPAIFFIWIPMIVGGGALFLALLLGGAAALACERIEERSEALPRVEPSLRLPAARPERPRTAAA